MSQSSSASALPSSDEAWPSRLTNLAHAALPRLLTSITVGIRPRTPEPHGARFPRSFPSQIAEGQARDRAVAKVKLGSQPPLTLLVPLALVRPMPRVPRTSLLTPMGISSSRRFPSFELARAWMGTLLGRTSVPGLRAGQTEALGAAGTGPARLEYPSRQRRAVEHFDPGGRQGDPGKVIRKLVHGPHPELEVGRFLTTDAQFDGVPATLGWVELAQGEETVTLSVLQQFVPNEGDGWGWVLERLQRAGRTGRRRRIARGDRCGIRQVGHRTAEMHRAFADWQQRSRLPAGAGRTSGRPDLD